MFGLGLDADAIRTLDVATNDRPHDADEQAKTGEITDERIRHVDVAVQELPGLGDLVVDFENRGDGEQHQEGEVDERMHDASGGIAQQGLHVDTGAEIAEATLDVLLCCASVVRLAACPVLHPLAEQHCSVDEQDRRHDVEGDLQRGRDASEDLSCDW